MTKSVLSSIVLFASVVSFAFNNPQIKACNVVHGEFLVVNSSEDQIGLCKLGPAFIGSIDLLNKDARIEVPLSLHNYKKGIAVCPNRNLATLTTFDGDGILVCYYSDGSVIDIDTLSSGKNSDRNTQLNTVLGL